MEQIAEADRLERGNVVDYKTRGQWIRAGILGAQDGLVAMSSFMIGASSAVDGDLEKKLLVMCLAELVAGLCCMAIGEFISELPRRKLDGATTRKNKNKTLPSSTRAALSSATAFAVGALMPLMAGVFVRERHARVGAVLAATTVGLAGFGATGAYLGGTSISRSVFRLLAGGWLAMAVTFSVSWVFRMVFHAEPIHVL